MATFATNDQQVLVVSARGEDETFHLAPGNGQGRVLGAFGVFEVVVIVGKERQFGGAFDVPVCILRGGVGKQEVRDEVFQHSFGFPVDNLSRVSLGHVDIGTIGNDIVRRAVLAPIGSPKDIPFVVRRGCISYRYPGRCTFGFGDGIKGRLDAEVLMSFHIRQCAHGGRFISCAVMSEKQKKHRTRVVCSTLTRHRQTPYTSKTNFEPYPMPPYM